MKAIRVAFLFDNARSQLRNAGHASRTALYWQGSADVRALLTDDTETNGVKLLLGLPFTVLEGASASYLHLMTDPDGCNSCGGSGLIRDDDRHDRSSRIERCFCRGPAIADFERP